MSTSLHGEKDLEDFDGRLPEGHPLIHFKIVGVGPNTMERADYSGFKLCEIVRQQPGFFLMSDDGSGFREALHDLVDRFCDAQEGK